MTAIRAMEAVSNGNWDNGGLVTLTPNAGSNTYQCTNIQNAATGLFLYNASGNDHDITVWVTTANASSPTKVIVPGTTGNQGLATIVAINGAATNTVTVTMAAGQPAQTQVQAFLGSLAFPMGGGISNNSMPDNGQPQSFNKFSRYYTVPASQWYEFSLESNVDQFMCAQFGPGQSSFTVYCVNPGPNAAANVVQADPANPVAVKFIQSTDGQKQKLSSTLFGNGQQVVWINADSVQNSQSATIALSKLG